MRASAAISDASVQVVMRKAAYCLDCLSTCCVAKSNYKCKLIFVSMIHISSLKLILEERMFIKKILCFMDELCHIGSVFQNHFAGDALIILVQPMLCFFG